MTWAQVAAQNLLHGLQGRLEAGLFYDVMIYVDDVEFPCHRIILCAYSDYFQAMFTSGMQEAITQSVKLNDVSHQTFGIILEALYNGKDILDERNVIEIWRVASMLQISCLRQYCEDFLADHISNENCLTIWREARLSSCKVLANEAWNFVHREFPSIRTTEDFLCCDLEDICLMVGSEDLNVPNEEEVVEAILLWLAHEEDRRQHITRLFALARLNLVSEDFILRRLLTNQMILERPEQLAKVSRGPSELPRRAVKAFSKIGVFRKQASPLLLMTLTLQQKMLNGLRWGTAPTTVEVLALEMVRKSLEYRILKARRHDECPPVSMYRHASPFDNVMLVLGEGKDNFYAYRFKSEEWFQLPALPEDMGLGSSACTYGDDVFVSGGKNTMTALFEYVCRKNVWVKMEPMGTGRRNHVNVAIGHCLYVLGGLNNEVTTLSSVECYDIKKAVWTEVGVLHTAVRSSGSAVVGCKIIICGGKESDTVTTRIVQCFNTSTNTSYVLGELPNETCLPRTLIGGGSKIYLITQEGSVWKMKLNDRSVIVHAKSQLWDFARYWHGALLHDGIVYVVAGETPDNSELQDSWAIELQGVFQGVKNLRPANITRCMACLRTSMEKSLLKDSLAMDISRV